MTQMENGNELFFVENGLFCIKNEFCKCLVIRCVIG